MEPPKETQFKPGQSGNPAGRPPEAPPELKNYTKTELALSLCKLMRKSVKELALYLSDPGITTLDMVIGQTLKECMKKGDFWALDKMLERVIGKVPLKQELTGADGAPLTPPRLLYYEIPDPDEQPGPK